MKRATFIVVILGILFLVLLAARTNVVPLRSASAIEDRNAKTKTEKPPAVVPVSESDFAKRINQLIDESGFTSARWGVSVISLSDGAPLYSRNGDRLFTPASNMKIYTTAVALDLLGADYRWRTSVYVDKPPDASGTVSGDLILYGRGAPDLVSHNRNNNQASLGQLADDLYARGIRRVQGNIVGDESYFRGNSLGDGWQWNDIQWYFGAEASALSIDGNEIHVSVVPSSNAKEPPAVRTTDGEAYVTVRNRMVVGKPSMRPTIGMNRGLSDNNITVWGEMPPGSKGFGARLSVHNPALRTAHLFRDALKKRGISIDGQAESRDSRVAPSQRFNPTQAVELASVTSKPLSEIARITNKESNNLFAELILRTLGRERGAMLETPEPPGRERGDDEAGVAVVRLWLARAGVPTTGLAIHDGSGLSRLNLVTPDSTARLLIAVAKTASGELFKQSLPIAGKDGTLAGRLKSVNERVIAKTGSLTYNNSLSGFATSPEGKIFAFSILCNDQTGRGNNTRLIDDITALIAVFPNLPDAKPQNPNK
ncbi:MAG TPA: D-alanyl-D-alanine carboxypeptidase/D-alanyl-D-alanine-endopeptidase [Pyrinomonadaceae bacterium]|nr:D-alanyl-D-alanine carboxypeptidase/D-alanyl-D-alanine-endopeptidase [Pyrinomonadaceae bacterium]